MRWGCGSDKALNSSAKELTQEHVLLVGDWFSVTGVLAGQSCSWILADAGQGR